MAKKKEKLFSKIVVLVFLILIILGFMLPGFLDFSGGGGSNSYVEPRLCQTDADCYLICDDVPTQVLCHQNLCQKNSCDEFSLYEYELKSKPFVLSIELNGEIIDIISRAKSNDNFIKFDEKFVNLYSKGLALRHVLDKINIRLDSECLYIDSTSYCNDETNELKLLVNGVQSFAYENYIPQGNEKIEIVYQ